MATLALSTIGTALGGPVGGAIGSLIGQGIDQSLFGPGPRRGPRLNDLSVQTSSYGTQIPRIYGTMRVAGSIVWATDLKESSEPSGGAKGQPEIIVYSYSASFAVALSSRAASGVGRIWADGKLLRGAAGDFKVKTGFRFYPGDEDQPVDPLIATIEGIDRATAFRGLALCVFEDLQLAEFGNRLPFLTFEIFGDQQSPTLGAILNDAGSGCIASDASESVCGYAAYGSNRRAALQPLVERFSVPLFDDGVVLRPPAGATILALYDELGCGSDSQAQARVQRTLAPASSLPSSLTLSYYDPARDFQLGQMRANAGLVGVGDAVELPVAMGADQAKALAENHLAGRWAERDRLTLRLPPNELGLEPGSKIVMQDGAVWRVEQAVIEEMAVRAELTRIAERSTSLVADPGSHLPPADLIAAPSVVAVLDLPDIGIGRHDVPTLQVAVCQPVANWRQVPLDVTIGGLVQTMASARSEAIIGTALGLLSDGQTTGFDDLNLVEIELSDDEHWLESRDDAALANGVNLAVLGSELLQFGRAVAIGLRRFRLEHLLRGRFGSEWATESHVAGEKFVMIDAASLQEIVLPASAIGTTASIKARGLADDLASPIQQLVTGENLRPPSPTDLQAQLAADGSLMISWTRRSRLGWSGPTGTEAPIGENSERYRVVIEGSAGTLSFESTVPNLTVAAQALAGMTGDITISVVQVGDYAASRPVITSIPI